MNIVSRDVGSQNIRHKTHHHALPTSNVMADALRHMAQRNCFVDRTGITKSASGKITGVGWVEAGMALKLAYGDEVGCDLWAITHIDDRARTDAPAQWASFSGAFEHGHVTIATLLKAAKDTGFHLPSVSEPDDTKLMSWDDFTMSATDGLTREVEVGRGREKRTEKLWLCSAFEILGACRDPSGRDWGKQIRFRDADGRVHTFHVPDAALQGDPAPLCASLAREGLKINRSGQKHPATYLSAVPVEERVTVVARTGWHEIGGHLAFVLPDDVISKGVNEAILLDQKAVGPYQSHGSIEEWQQGVGRISSGNYVPTLLISAALAGPLMQMAGMDGGGIHVYGRSSIGKTAALSAAASVWGLGNSGGYLRSWRATTNGLEGAAASATDTCLILDEVGVGEARDVSTGTYSLANGAGKTRAARDGSIRTPATWRIFLLSSGELPMDAKIAEDRARKPRARQSVRLLDVQADRGFGFGVFDSRGEFETSAKLADALKDAASTAYGTAGPEFVRRLLRKPPDELRRQTKAALTRYVTALAGDGASEQIVRAAKVFGLIGLAGELATKIGVTPWARGSSYAAAKWAFDAWVERRGGTEPREEQQAIEQVRLLIEQHGDARFEPVDGTAEASVRDRLGWRKGQGASREWWVPPETWKTEFSAGLDPTFVARTLAKRGMLKRQDEKHLQCVVTLHGRQQTRCYVLNSTILED